jgi:hypothetical protein
MADGIDRMDVVLDGRIAQSVLPSLVMEQEILMTDTYATSATQYIDAEGIRYAYRRFGRETAFL